MNYNKISNIFLASSGSLLEERQQIEILVSRLCDKYINTQSHYLKTAVWEKESLSFSDTRKQDDFNKLVKKSNVFFLLIGEKVGKYSKEEFEIAYKNFKAKNRPSKIVVFFKNINLNINEISIEDIKNVQELKKEILERNQFYYEYSNIDELRNYVTKEIEGYVDENISPPNSKYEIIYTHAEIFLKEKNGNAIYKKTQIIKLLEDTQYIDNYITTDGEIDKSSLISEGKDIKNLRFDLGRYYFKIDKGETLKSGQYTSSNYSCSLINTFPTENEFWEIDAMSPCKLLKITIYFPKVKPCKSHETILIRNFKNEICTQAKLRKENGIIILDLEIEREYQYDKIRINWSW